MGIAMKQPTLTDHESPLSNSALLCGVVVIMGIVALFVAARAGHGVPYYGGLTFFAFAVLFVFLLIKHGFDKAEGIRSAGMPVTLRVAVSLAIGYFAYGFAAESIPDKAMLAAAAAAIVLFGLLEIVDRIAVRGE
jgi:purine-cytosine permease-like protein